MDDSFFKKLESVDRFVVKRDRSPLSAPNDGPEFSRNIPPAPPPAPPPELSPSRPVDAQLLLKALVAKPGLVTVGELARLIPESEPQALISGLLDARAKGWVAILDGDEVGVSITDAGKAVLT
jgi:hypothetical protein